MRRPKKRHKKFIIPRTTVLIFIFAALSMVLIHRLFSLQIIHGQEYADNFSIMTTKTRTLKSTRGNIYDRNGQVIASNELSYSITLEDSGDYASNTERNRSLNGEIYKIIQIIESNGDTSSSDFRISVDSSGNYSYDVEGTTLSRFKADVYGHSYIDDLTTEEANASAQQMVEDMLKRYEIPYDHSDYKASELKKAQEAGLPEQLTKEETLKIISVRYALSTTSFRKYIPVTIATDVSENTVAAIQENKSLLEGVDVQEDSVRVYTDSIYFAPLLGYTGKVSSDELADLRTENPDAGYSTTSIVGKSGLEKVMESTLQGKDGSEKVYVDYYGKVLQIGEDSKEDPVQGNNVYLTIDKDLQIACYKVLEQKIAGVLVALQQRAFAYLQLLDSGKYTHEQILEVLQFLQKQLYCKNPETKNLEDAELVIYLKEKLNRPMRVCGMVKNVGEPGGGPFLAYNSDGTISLQILESSQIDMDDPEKKEMFEKGTHFNPVDLVCAVRDYKGHKFNLVKYVDKATGFISYKSKNGKDLKALELPGLWNGAMSDWNTVFVEVPLTTFNPVKTVNDLLREQHQ